MDMARECLDTCESGRDSLHAAVTDFMRGEAAEKYKSDGIRLFTELEDNTARIRDILGMDTAPYSCKTEQRRFSRKYNTSFLETNDDELKVKSSNKRSSNETRHSVVDDSVVDLAEEDDDDSDEEEDDDDKNFKRTGKK